jgi:hypothetical protein
MKSATKQCWQCDNYQQHNSQAFGFCDYAAGTARDSGCPVMRDGAKVAAGGNATGCDGYSLTMQALRDICRMGFDAPWADASDYQRLSEEDGDRPDGDPNAGIVTLPADARAWGERQAGGGS